MFMKTNLKNQIAEKVAVAINLTILDLQTSVIDHDHAFKAHKDLFILSIVYWN